MTRQENGADCLRMIMVFKVGRATVMAVTRPVCFENYRGLLLARLDLPERAGCIRRTLHELACERGLRLKQRREGGVFGPTGGLFLKLKCLIGEFLAGLDIPGGGFFHAIEAED